MSEFSTKDGLQAFAGSIGVDSLGVADVAEYDKLVPNDQRPAYFCEGMRRIVVVTKHLLTGAMAFKDVSTQSLNSHLALDEAGDCLYELAEWLEERGHLAVPLSPEFADTQIQKTGAGLLDLKYVAEFAGLGHVGLNLNFLTPEYGSRVYMGALLTDAELEPDQPLKDPICPGMTCGRCAATCPTKAIPLEAERDAHVNDYRDLDQKACSQGAMRLSIRSLFKVLRMLTFELKIPDIDRVLDMTYWKDFWIATNSKRGAFAACFECMYVCPYGSKDVKKIFAIPYRMQDVKGGKVEHTRTATSHLVKFVGPPTDREHEYNRSRDFQELGR